MSIIIDDEIRGLIRRIEQNPGSSSWQIAALVSRLAVNCSGILDNNNEFPATGLAAYPVDEEGYALSFDPVADEAEFTKTWQRYGIVVGKEILTKAQCEEALTGIKARSNSISKGNCDLEHSSTWPHMPRDANKVPLLSRGFLEIYHDDVLAKLRQNIRAYLHHVLIWKRPDLWVSFDRIGIKLPHHEESRALPLHVDQNPNVHPGFKTIQGVMALTDCPAERGTFLAVPGSRSLFPYYAGMARNNGEYVELDTTSEIAPFLQSHAQVLPLRQGDFLSWDNRTTHANTDNVSNSMRGVFYMSAGPACPDNAEAVSARLDAIATGMGSNMREAIMHASKKPRFTDPAVMAEVRQVENLNLLGELLYGTTSYHEIVTTPAP